MTWLTSTWRDEPGGPAFVGATCPGPGSTPVRREGRVAESPLARPVVFAGLDVGKGHHHLCALDRDGRRLVDEVVVNDEAALRGVLERLLGGGGPVLLVVD